MNRKVFRMRVAGPLVSRAKREARNAREALRPAGPLTGAMVAEYSTFILKLLQPLGNDVETVLSPDPVADTAFEWLHRGVELITTDVPSAIEALRMSVSLGSDEAMAWLGAALVRLSLKLHDDERRQPALVGLGWLRPAAAIGHGFATEKLALALDVLPAALVEEWDALPSHRFATLH